MNTRFGILLFFLVAPSILNAQQLVYTDFNSPHNVFTEKFVEYDPHGAVDNLSLQTGTVRIIYLVPNDKDINSS